MEQRLKQLDAIPRETRDALGQFVEELRRAAGSNLLSLALYGGAARGRFRPEKSDLNVVIVLRDVSVDSLTRITPPLRSAFRSIAVDPFILSQEELGSAADVFATKFLDIKTHHLVLAGEDPFEGLVLARESLRFRVEQELRNLELRLRRRFLVVSEDRTALVNALGKLRTPLCIELSVLLHLVGRELIDPDRPEEIIKAASEAFGLDGEALLEVIAAEGPSSKADCVALFGRILSSLSSAAGAAKGLEV